VNFKEYLESKKIDPKEFALKERDLFMELKSVFDQVHPDSFTAQKLFLINPIRRKYPFVEEVKTASAPKTKLKPKIKPRT